MFSHTGSSAEIEAGFDGKAPSRVKGTRSTRISGRVQVGGSGRGLRLVCASASAEVGTGGTSQHDSASPLGGLLDRILP